MKTILLVCLVITFSKWSHAVFVDPQLKLVEWAGWGTGIYSSGNQLAGMSDDVQEEIHSALFSPDHLNLNVVRYLIAGTTPGDTSCGPFENGRFSESFRDGQDKPYMWSRDPRSRKLLQAAKRHGADTFEAFVMSPPSWLTRNGCTNGNPDGEPLHDNFDPENANAFADYLTEVVKYYHETHNISFTSVAPYNKPLLGNFNGNGSVEGCNIDRTTMVEIIKSLHAAIRTKHLSFCSLSVSDEANVEAELASQSYLTDANVTGLYRKINVHSNGMQPKTISELFTLSQKNKHILWMSDTLRVNGPLENMTLAMSLANAIIFDLRNMLPSAWGKLVYWEVFGSESETSGRIITIPYSNATVENIKFRSGYYVIKQFSKHIRKGYSIIHISDQDSVAAYHATSNILVMVIANSNTTKVSKSFDLHRFSTLGEMFAYRTSRVEAHVPIPVPSSNRSTFDFEFPAESVTTIKILNALINVRENLIRNGDFESGGHDPWFLQYGLRDDNGVNGNYVRRGGYSGFMDLTESKLQLVQTASVSTAGTFYLSAWCATTGPNTFLGVLINGLQGPQVTIEPSKGYQLYGLSIEAKPTDLISIYFVSDQGSYTAQIDDVVLH